MEGWQKTDYENQTWWNPGKVKVVAARNNLESESFLKFMSVYRGRFDRNRSLMHRRSHLYIGKYNFLADWCIRRIQNNHGGPHDCIHQNLDDIRATFRHRQIFAWIVNLIPSAVKLSVNRAPTISLSPKTKFVASSDFINLLLSCSSSCCWSNWRKKTIEV